LNATGPLKNEKKSALPVDPDATETLMTQRDCLRVLFKHAGTVLLAFVTVIAATGLGLELQTPQYEAGVRMLITAEKQVESPYYRQIGGHRSNEITLTQSEIVTSSPVIGKAVRALRLETRPPGYEAAYASPLKARLIKWQTRRWRETLARLSPEERDRELMRRAIADLKNKTRVEPVRDTNLFNIIVRDPDPEVAARAANVVSRAYLAFDLKQQLVEVSGKYGEKHPRVLLLRDLIAAADSQLHGLPVDDLDAIGQASVKVVEQAMAPSRPAGRPKAAVLLMAALMAAFLGVLLAFVFEYADQTVRGPADLEQELQLPHLGSVTRRPFFGSVVLKNPEARGAYAASYRGLADQIYLMMKDSRDKTLLLASPGPREDGALAAVNLGACFAGHLLLKVLLIDANLRRPALANTLRYPAGPGLVGLAAGTAKSAEAIHAVSYNLHVISGGATGINPIPIFEMSATRDLLAKWKEEYDLVIFNAANLRDYKDAYFLAELADRTALVIAQGVTRRAAARRAADTLRSRKARVLGAILTGRKYHIPQFIYDRV
jgi:Mrp family chromosome partitioning ATPase